jgi:hypothetical protein
MMSGIMLILYLLEYRQVGYWAALAIGRTKQFEVMTEVISSPTSASCWLGW